MDMCNIPHALTGLSSTQFLTINSAGINDPKEPENLLL
jgi:hypothetical protein